MGISNRRWVVIPENAIEKLSTISGVGKSSLSSGLLRMPDWRGWKREMEVKKSGSGCGKARTQRPQVKLLEKVNTPSELEGQSGVTGHIARA